MKNKYLFAAVLLALSLLGAKAGPVTAEKARAEAESFLMPRQSQAKSNNTSTARPSLTLAYKGMGKTQDAGFYVFNRSNTTGYVVVAGDDRMPAILGYSDTGTFDMTNIPDNMKAFLDEYAREADYLRAHPQLQNEAKVATYDTEVAPLLKEIKWNQTDPYNQKCPNDYPTGCVATAMGQVMYYYKYPEKGKGGITYTWTRGNKTLTGNFSSTTFKWSDMQDQLTKSSPEAAKSAVATLLYNVGLSVRMNYGPASEGGSGASPSYIAPALVNNFGYDQGCHLRSREYYTKTDWEATVRNELDNKRPVLYGGFTVSAAGHSFVCDGYNRQGYYHMNWGWDGLNNGYFLLTALDPKTKGTGGGAEGEGFNYNQTMVIGIQKPVEGSKKAYSFVFKKIDQKPLTVARNEAATLTASGIHTDGIDPLDVQTRFEVRNSDGKVVATSEVKSQNIPLGEAISYSGTITLPDSVSDGTYEARLAGRIETVDEAGVFHLLPSMIGENGYYEVKVQNGNVTYTPKGVPALSLQSLTVNPNPIESKKRFTITAVIKNSGGEFDGKMAWSLEHPDGGTKSHYSNDVAVNIKAGETATVTFSDSLVLYGNDNYIIRVATRDGVDHKQLGESLRVKVIGQKEEPKLVGADYMDVVTGADNAKRDNMDFVATVTNNGGDFDGKLTCLIFNNKSYSDASEAIASLDTVQVQIAKGETKQIEIKGKFLDCKDKGTYYACLYNVDDDDFVAPDKYASVAFTIRDDASSEQPRLYLKKQVSVVDGGAESKVKVLATILNSGGTFNGTIKADFFNQGDWVSLCSMTKQVTIGYGETVTVELTGETSQLKAGKNYDLDVTFNDKEDKDWKSYALHPTYSNLTFTMGTLTGIEAVDASQNQQVWIYNLTGIIAARTTVNELPATLSRLPHGHYIVRYQQGTRFVSKHVLR